MPHAPDLSIVIVNWNTRELLRSCLRSVLSGLGSLSAEVFVVDNNSSDGSADMVERCFPRVLLIRNDANRGFAAANNQALLRARGRHLLLLNSDTEILGSVLTASCKYLDERSEVGVLGVRVLNPDLSLQPTCFRDPSLLNLLLYALLLHRLSWPRWVGRERLLHWNRDDDRNVDVVTGCFLLARRAACADIGLLDEQFFFYGEEADWCRRFRRAQWEVRFAPVGKIIHHGGASTERISASLRLMLAEAHVRYLRKHSGLFSAATAWIILHLAQAIRGLWRIRGRGPCIRRLTRSWPRNVTPQIPRLHPANSRATDTPIFRRAA